MELFFLILAVGILYKIVRAFFNWPKISGFGKNKKFSGAPSSRNTPPPGAPAEWYGADQSFVVNGFSIPGGLVYVGGKLPDYSGFNDPCLINTDLDIASGTSPSESVAAFHPGYGKMTPGQRGAYLSWLSGERSDPSASIAYVFLFLYGLERRLLVDGQRRGISPKERGDIVLEILRLLQIYGENRSFRGHALNLLAMEWVLYGNPNTIPAYLDFSDRYCAEPFAAVLAWYAAHDQPIPAEIALQWVILHPERGLKTTARRCPEFFRWLFTIRYREKYGKGMVIHPNRTPLTLTYRGANPSLGDHLKLRIPKLPSPFVLTTPMKRIAAIAEQCTAELEAYSLLLGRGGEPDSSAALALLPPDLLPYAPASKTMRDRLLHLCANGPALAEIGAVYQILGQKTPIKIDKRAAENLAATLSSLGFGMAPDERIHGLRPAPDGRIAIYSPLESTASSDELAVGAIMVRLGSIVAQVSGETSPDKQKVLVQLISENEKLFSSEKLSLTAFVYWAFSTPQSIAGLKGALKTLPSGEKQTVGRILGAVASADGRVDPAEVRQIEKLYFYLGLEKEQAVRDIHSAALSGGIISAKEAGEKKGFVLNLDLIRIREEETRQVNGVLQTIHTSPKDEKTQDAVGFTDDAEPFAGLDVSHRELLHSLLRKETWEREEYFSLCARLSLPPDGALEIVNEWAFAAGGAPLVEDGDPIYIDISLAGEILSHGQQKDANLTL